MRLPDLAPADPRLGTAWTAVVLAVATVLTAATVVPRAVPGEPEVLTAVDIGAGVLALGALAVGLRYPVAGALAIAVLAAVSPGATACSTIATLLVAQRRPLAPAVLVGLAGVLAHLVQAWVRPVHGISTPWWIVLALTAYAALVAWGLFSQARWALMASLRERARRAELEAERRLAAARAAERTRIDREMHDVLAHRLSLVATAAGALEYRPDGPPEQVALAAGTVRRGVHEALEELRDVVGVLRADESVGPCSDPQERPVPGFDDLPALFAEARSAGATVTTTIEVDGTVPPALGRPIYRIVQEGLTNARKHAPAADVRVHVHGRSGGTLTVAVTNPWSAGQANGAGAGVGLVGLTERAELAGGTLEVETAGGEFRLRAQLPWPGE